MIVARRGLLRLAALLACLVCWSAVGAGSAGAAVYWGGSYGLGAADLDGGEALMHYFKPLFPSESSAPLCGVAVSGSYLYWAGASGLGRVNLEGAAAPATVAPHLDQPCGVAIDQAHVYWGNYQGGSLGRANLDGSEANASFITGLERPCGVAVDGGHVYWVDQGGVGRANLDGSEAERHFLSSPYGGCGLAVDSHHIYWGQYGSIGRANLDGSGFDPNFIAGIGSVAGIALDAGHIYWTDRPEGMAFSTIGRANIDGSEANRDWITTDQFNLGGIAVDVRASPPPLPLPSRPFRLGQARYNRKTGAATLAVYVPERGELEVTSPGLSWKVLKGPEPPSWRAGSFTWQLKVWPGASGPAGKRIRTELRAKGRVPVILRVSYAEERQLPVTATKRLVLRKRLEPHRARAKHPAR